MARRVLLLALLLAVETACPHAWGRRGTIDRAAERDMIEYTSRKNCPLDEEDWMDFCADFTARKSDPRAQQLCPLECRPNDGRP